MRSTILIATLLAAMIVAICGGRDQSALAGDLNAEQIERLTGLKGKLDEKEHVFKVSAPRVDLKVVARGVHLTPPMGLTSWAAFKSAGKQSMVMGDVVLEEDQVNPVMSAALDNGLQVTALHNHFLWTSQTVMFMHIAGIGDEARLASAVGKVFDTIKQTSGREGRKFVTEIDPTKTTLDPRKLDAILGTQGHFENGVYKAVFGRIAKMHGHEIGSAMGVNTWAAFAGSGDETVVDGDFAVLEPELQPVLKKLRGASIDVVAIHQHMTGEDPRITFLHYWGIGKADDLAKGVRNALDAARAK